MLLTFISRETLLEALPKGLVCGEIGTAVGDFAQQILDRAAPTRLHLIDPWRHIDVPEYQLDSNNVDDAEGQRRYESVCARFDRHAANGQVVIHRALSVQEADSFPDNYFDFVYIDGDHTKPAVAADLRAFDRKVKPQGLIMGHDYVTHPNFIAKSFGVVEAVNEFVRETGYEFLMLTYEGSPTYVLAKQQNSPLALRLASYLLGAMVPIVVIEDAENKSMGQWDVLDEGGKRLRTLLAFR
ncbi:MAG: class I SAM-dependent methyltransferase [Rhodospirillales bacterium]|nr:MAG: class I SAM-dependent methyltransferase [Rhodospirillales bacterium]